MKSKMITALLAFVATGISSHSFAAAVSASAETPEIRTEQPEAPKALLDRTNVAIGYRFGNVVYNEPGVMKQHGTMHGVFGNVIMPTSTQGLFVLADGEILAGTIRYDGGLQDEDGNRVSDYSANAKDSLVTLKGALAFDYRWDQNTAIRPFAGLGVRALNDRIQGPGSYDREISYTYLPIGIDARITPTSSWMIGALVEYDLFLGGTVKSKLSQADPRYPDIENQQRKGSGYRLALQSRNQIGENVSLMVEPYYQVWDIGPSEYYFDGKGHAFLEPKNDSKMAGLSLGLGF